MTEEKPLSEEEIKKKAYSLALRLKHSGLEPEIIYARLEKQGIPEELAKQAVKNLMAQKTIEEKKEAEANYNARNNIRIVKIVILLGATIVSFFLDVRFRIIPYGLIITVLISYFVRRKRT